MTTPLIAALLSALLWPGAGQIYNRDFKKGMALTVLTVLLGASLVVGVGRDVLQSLPQNPSLFDLTQIRQIKDVLLKANPRLYGTYSLLLTLTWVFSVIDAFLSARERRRLLLTASPPTDAPL
jgi:TM2 domain-containing membrane protein YozV